MDEKLRDLERRARASGDPSDLAALGRAKDRATGAISWSITQTPKDAPGADRHGVVVDASPGESSVRVQTWCGRWVTIRGIVTFTRDSGDRVFPDEAPSCMSCCRTKRWREVMHRTVSARGEQILNSIAEDQEAAPDPDGSDWL